MPSKWTSKLILIEHSPERWDFDVITFLEDAGYRKVRKFGGNIALERN
jgi:hypothetical protein